MRRGSANETYWKSFYYQYILKKNFHMRGCRRLAYKENLIIKIFCKTSTNIWIKKHKKIFLFWQNKYLVRLEAFKYCSWANVLSVLNFQWKQTMFFGCLRTIGLYSKKYQIVGALQIILRLLPTNDVMFLIKFNCFELHFVVVCCLSQ